MSISRYNIKLANIQKQKKMVLDDIMMIENVLKLINEKIQMIDATENKKMVDEIAATIMLQEYLANR